jgi:hypothetical protein
VNFVLKDAIIFDQITNYVEKGVDKSQIFDYLKEMNSDIEGTFKYVPNNENARIDDFLHYEDVDNDDMGGNESNDDDDNINNRLGVIVNDAELSSSFKDTVKGNYEYIVKQGKSITTNNGLTSEVLGINGYLSVAPLSILIHYIGTNTNGYGIDFGGGFGYSVLLYAACSKIKFLSTEINFERYQGSINLQNFLANEAATTNNIQRQQNMTENVYFMFTGDKSCVEIDWSHEELKETKITIFGDTTTTLTPRTASVGSNVPELIKSNASRWKVIHFFSTGWVPKDIEDVLNVIKTFSSWTHFFTDLKPRYFERKGYMEIINPSDAESKIIKIPKCSMAGQNHSRDFYLYIIERLAIAKTKPTKKSNSSSIQDETQVFTSTVEDLGKEVLFLSTVAKWTKKSRGLRAAACKVTSAYVPPLFNRSTKRRKITSSAKAPIAAAAAAPPAAADKTDLFKIDFLKTLDDMTVAGRFPSHIKSIYDKGVFLSNRYHHINGFHSNNSRNSTMVTAQKQTISNQIENSKVNNSTNSTIVTAQKQTISNQIEKLVQFKDSLSDSKIKKADLRQLAQQLLEYAEEIESNSANSESASSKSASSESSTSETSNVLEKQVSDSSETEKKVSNSSQTTTTVAVESNIPTFSPLQTVTEIIIDFFNSLNKYPATMKQKAAKMNPNEYICSCNLDATIKPQYILFFSKNDLLIDRDENGAKLKQLTNRTKAEEFVRMNQRISLLYKMPSDTCYYDAKSVSFVNFFAFINQMINPGLSLTYNNLRDLQKNDEIMTPIIKDIVSKLQNWCSNDVFKMKLQKLFEYIQNQASLDMWLPKENQLDPQILTMMDFPEDYCFSVFFDNLNIDNYAQLGYSFIEKVKCCPNIKYVATSYENIVAIGDGRVGLFRNRNYSEISINTRNKRYPNGSFANEMELVFNNLVDALVMYVKKNPIPVFDMEGEFRNHFEPFPHLDSDDSDSDQSYGEGAPKKLSSEINIGRNNLIRFTHSTDLKSLLPKNRINDNVICSYLFYIQQKYYLNTKTSVKNVVICTDTLLYEHVQKKLNRNLIRWISIYTKEQITNAKFFIYPIYNSLHWVWFVVNVSILSNVKLLCLDSLSTSAALTGWKRICGEWIITNINQVYSNLKHNVEIERNDVRFMGGESYPQQPDITNCGLYTLLGIEYFLEDPRTEFKFDIKEILEYKARVRKFFKDKLIEDYNMRETLSLKPLDELFDSILNDD